MSKSKNSDLIEKIIIAFDNWKEKRLKCKHIIKREPPKKRTKSLAWKLDLALSPYGCKKLHNNICHYMKCPVRT